MKRSKGFRNFLRFMIIMPLFPIWWIVIPIWAWIINSMIDEGKVTKEEIYQDMTHIFKWIKPE